MTTPRTYHLAPEEIDRLLVGGLTDAEAREHLARCDHCRREMDDMRALLGLLKVDAEPPLGAGYGRWAWRRIEGQIQTQPEGTSVSSAAAPSWHRFAIAATLLVAIVGATTTVLLWHERGGRMPPTIAAPATLGASSPVEPEARAPITSEELAAKVGTHLESFWRLLVEVSNASPGNLRALEAAGVVERAHRLAAESRRHPGLDAVLEPEIRSTLRAMEAFLAELAREPSQVARDEERLRDLLFETRLAQARLRSQGRGIEL